MNPSISGERINKNINIEFALSSEKKKKKKRNTYEGNSFENMSKDFHNKVRSGYLKMAKKNRSSWSIVNADQPEHRVADSIWKRVRRMIENYKVS